MSSQLPVNASSALDMPITDCCSLLITQHSKVISSIVQVPLKAYPSNESTAAAVVKLPNYKEDIKLLIVALYSLIK
jgi:hypothetical protein